jgi:preprotein translocase subunit SecF
VGAVFGGLLSALLTQAIVWIQVFNLFKQPVEEASVAFVVAVGLVFGAMTTLYSANSLSLWFKTRLMRDYAEAREIVEKRDRKKP